VACHAGDWVTGFPYNTNAEHFQPKEPAA
jgi:hypothetical protein